jgi:hypothetical protein
VLQKRLVCGFNFRRHRHMLFQLMSTTTGISGVSTTIQMP